MQEIQPPDAINNYLDALTYFYSYIHYDPSTIVRRWDLSRLEKLLVRLGHPEKKFPSLLIAGTKGKGSTAAMCESMLRAAGYSTGLYTSPHLHTFRERIRLNGELVPEQMLVDLALELKPYFETTPDLTAFEVITIVAIMAFAEAEVDAVVLEVGLGGRLDATNVVHPTVAVLTSISYDHTQILGETLTKIAREKAGIIRPGAMVVSAPQMEEAMDMIEEVCKGYQAHLLVVDREWDWEIESNSLEGQYFTAHGVSYYMPLLGRYQVTNAVTALAAVEVFADRLDLTVSETARQEGLAAVRWPGRLELLNRRPYLLVDSAMNGDSAEKLAASLAYYFPDHKPLFIFGASSDHLLEDMLEVLLPIADKMYMTAARHPRATDPAELARIAADMGYQTPIRPDLSIALNTALDEAAEDDLICVAGSLFLAANAREAWLRRQGEPLPPIDPVVISS